MIYKRYICTCNSIRTINNIMIISDYCHQCSTERYLDPQRFLLARTESFHLAVGWCTIGPSDIVINVLHTWKYIPYLEQALVIIVIVGRRYPRLLNHDTAIALQATKILYITFISPQGFREMLQTLFIVR